MVSNLSRVSLSASTKCCQHKPTTCSLVFTGSVGPVVSVSVDMDEMHVVEGLRGRENLFLAGFKYSRRRSRGTLFITWRCSHYKTYNCKASLRTSTKPVSTSLFMFT